MKRRGMMDERKKERKEEEANWGLRARAKTCRHTTQFMERLNKRHISARPRLKTTASLGMGLIKM